MKSRLFSFAAVPTLALTLASCYQLGAPSAAVGTDGMALRCKIRQWSLPNYVNDLMRYSEWLENGSNARLDRRLTRFDHAVGSNWVSSGMAVSSSNSEMVSPVDTVEIDTSSSANFFRKISFQNSQNSPSRELSLSFQNQPGGHVAVSVYLGSPMTSSTASEVPPGISLSLVDSRSIFLRVLNPVHVISRQFAPRCQATHYDVSNDSQRIVGNEETAPFRLYRLDLENQSYSSAYDSTDEAPLSFGALVPQPAIFGNVSGNGLEASMARQTPTEIVEIRGATYRVSSSSATECSENWIIFPSPIGGVSEQSNVSIVGMTCSRTPE